MAEAMVEVLGSLSFVGPAFTQENLAIGVPGDSLAALFEHSFTPGRPGGLLSTYGVEMWWDENILPWGMPVGTTHGSPYHYDRWVPLILMGPGIEPEPPGRDRRWDGKDILDFIHGRFVFADSHQHANEIPFAVHMAQGIFGGQLHGLVVAPRELVRLDVVPQPPDLRLYPFALFRVAGGGQHLAEESQGLVLLLLAGQLVGAPNINIEKQLLGRA